MIHQVIFIENQAVQICNDAAFIWTERDRRSPYYISDLIIKGIAANLITFKVDWKVYIKSVCDDFGNLVRVS